MIQTTEVSITYKGDGVQTSFPYPYPYRNSDDIVGYIINDVGYEKRITNNFKYDKVSNIYQYPLAGDPLAAPYSIKLIRETPQQQNADLPGKLPFSLIEKSLDWIIMILQEIGSRCNSLWHIRNDCKLSETNARNSASAAAESEENIANSENLTKKWAMSPVSPDEVVDTNSPTGYTQSSRSWALYSEGKAQEVATSEANAKTSETNAEAFAKKAYASESNAQTSEANAKKSVTEALASERNAMTSATNAKASATNAKTSETNAKASEVKASASEANAKTSETHAKDFATNASISQANAIGSENNARDSETKAATSEAHAKTSETNAKDSETKAATSEANAKVSETNAKASEMKAATSEANAKVSETNAKASEMKAATSEANAKDAETDAKAWAVSDTSPDNTTDSSSSTGKTQSSRSWALEAKSKVDTLRHLLDIKDDIARMSDFRYIARNTAYKSGLYLYTPSLGVGYIIYVLKAGTTSSEEPNWSSIASKVSSAMIDMGADSSSLYEPDSWKDWGVSYVDGTATLLICRFDKMFSLLTRMYTRNYYMPKDHTFNLETFYGAGYLTGSGKKLYFNIPLSKRVHHSVSSVTARITNLILRGDSKYYLGGASQGVDTGSAELPKVSASVTDNWIYIIADINPSPTPPTNIVVGIACGISITFNS